MGAPCSAWAIYIRSDLPDPTAARPNRTGRWFHPRGPDRETVDSATPSTPVGAQRTPPRDRRTTCWGERDADARWSRGAPSRRALRAIRMGRGTNQDGLRRTLHHPHRSRFDRDPGAAHGAGATRFAHPTPHSRRAIHAGPRPARDGARDRPGLLRRTPTPPARPSDVRRAVPDHLRVPLVGGPAACRTGAPHAASDFRKPISSLKSSSAMSSIPR